MRWLLLLFVVGGCTMLTSKPIATWPHLKVVEHYVHDQELRDHCSKYAFMPEACAEFYFDRGECHIWLNADYPPMQLVVEHERAHCTGYDHVGSTEMQEVLNHYRKGVKQ